MAELIASQSDLMSAVLRDTTQKVLDAVDRTKPIEPEIISANVVMNVEAVFAFHNAGVKKDGGTKWPIPLSPSPAQIAMMMASLYPIVRVSCIDTAVDDEYDLLALYQTDGPDEGIYVTRESVLKELARKFDFGLKKRDMDEILEVLKSLVPRVTRNKNRDLIAVGNGIFDYSTKTLMPFSPDYVFLSKSVVDYVPNAQNPVIHNPDDNTDWDVESWVYGLTDDPAITQLLWEIMGAIIRPYVSWNKSAWFYSDTGSNGKGTLCELMRNLCGTNNYAAMKLSDFSKDFALEPLTHVSAIITDENNVGEFVDKAADLKAIITGDTIQINRKFKQPIAYQFKGFMVQCVNDMPKVKDKSESFYRRQLFIPFRKRFIGVTERKYIKDEYLKRDDVLQYVLCKVLNTNYYTLSEPDACKMALEEYKDCNDPVRQYWTEFSDRFAWDLLPFTFLYDHYKAWFTRNMPGGSIIGSRTFIANLEAVLKTDNIWVILKDNSGKYLRMRPGRRMDAPEPIIIEYNLQAWMNKNPTNSIARKAQPNDIKDVYRGVVRLNAATEMNTTSSEQGTE